MDSLIGGGNDGVSIGDNFQLGYDWLKPHLLTMKIVRPTADLIELHVQIDDEAEVIRTDAKSSVTQFNLVAFRLANKPESHLMVDDVKVELLKAK